MPDAGLPPAPSGPRVIVTRPEPEAQAWARQLQDAAALDRRATRDGARADARVAAASQRTWLKL